MAQRFFILGGGRFGTHLAARLCEFGCEVIIADNNVKRVEDLAEDGFRAVEMDCDDEGALKEAGVVEADAVVVAIGENMQASILATLLLKELGAKKVIARAVDVKQAQVLERLGADLVVLPSRDMALQLAETLRADLKSERVPISGEYQLAHIRLGPQLEGKTLAEARLPDQYGVTVVVISREQGEAKAAVPGQSDDRMKDFDPTPNFVLKANDWLSVTGRRKQIDKFERACAAHRGVPV